jgi:hypothetical protein
MLGYAARAVPWTRIVLAAVVVDVAPRSLAWRTVARAPAVLGLAAVWCGVVAHAGDGGLFGRSGRVLVEGLVALAVGASYAGWRRAWGEPTPGLLLATTVVPATTVWALVRPLQESLPVFPYGSDSAEAWVASTVGWLLLGTVALLVLTAALCESPWWAARSRKVTRRG